MLNRLTGSQHGKNKKNAPAPPHSVERLEDRNNLKTTYCTAPNVIKQLDKIRERVLLIAATS